MNGIPHGAALVSALAVFVGTAQAQSFNIDVGLGNSAPSSTYGAAAAQAGTWNEYDVGTTQDLVDLNGLATSVQFSSTGGAGNYTNNDPGTIGDDDALLDSIHDLGNIGSIQTTYTLTGLANGDYTAYIYGWTPYNSNVNFTRVRIIGGNTGNQVVGGSWTGSHVNLVTYAVDTYTVTAGTLQIRAKPESGWGSINGVQIIQNSSGCSSLPVNYCTPGTSSSGCQALLSSVGTSSATSASGFDLVASGVEGDKDGLFFQGTNGRQANSWGNGSSFQCVIPPVKRLGLLGKSGTSGACDGSFSQDLNAYWQANANANPGAGAVVQAQLWYRDPQNTSNQTTSLSEAIEWTVCP